MKKLSVLFLCFLLLTGCGAVQGTPSSNGGEAYAGSSSAGNNGTSTDNNGVSAGDNSSLTGDNSSAVTVIGTPAASMVCRIIEEDDGWLLLAGQDSTDVGVYRLYLERSIPVTFQNEREDDIEDGMLIEVLYTGGIQKVDNMDPDEFDGVTGITVLSDGYDNLCELYLEVLDDLWEEDPALRSDISMIGIDLSETSLNSSEQAAVAWAFAEEHQKEYVWATWAELVERGYIDEENLYWEDGCFFSIKDEPKPDSIMFDAQSWRSGLGAIYYNDCTAYQNSNGEWDDDYTVGSFAIA